MDARRDTGRWSQIMIIFGHRVGRFLAGRFFDGLVAPRVGYGWQGGAILKYVFGHVIKRRVSLKPILRNTVTGSMIRQTRLKVGGHLINRREGMRLILRKSRTHAHMQHALAILERTAPSRLWPTARRLSSPRTGVTTRRCEPTPIHAAQVLDALIA